MDIVDSVVFFVCLTLCFEIVSFCHNSHTCFSHVVILRYALTIEVVMSDARENIKM